jgi:RNA polymerase sigma factor (sigma-70 family)
MSEDDPAAIADPARWIEIAEDLPTLYRRRFGDLVRTATLLTGSPEVARDVVQDAFVKLHLAWSHVNDPEAYVRRSVVNGCHSYHRYSARRRGRPVSSEASVELGAHELDDALDALPSRQRAALVLRYYEGLSEVEIAHALGCRPGTVGSLIHRGLTRLKGALS